MRYEGEGTRYELGGMAQTKSASRSEVARGLRAYSQAESLVEVESRSRTVELIDFTLHVKSGRASVLPIIRKLRNLHELETERCAPLGFGLVRKETNNVIIVDIAIESINGKEQEYAKRITTFTLPPAASHSATTTFSPLFVGIP